ncbi:alpha/beta fold hydrolase [Roseateles toxinivorans]|uniref:Pimeloyl-ACP methyl ester carboxylesterase n=1 Tax=Roseateles toxinivorans TaxID=270368 RepID=A0A4R6QDT4_9BURK|nr:alpha/beta hydrolase [Roseateles toxinivorans]TDP60480.1 pimeloyl-ACP methyl ester carboxylesterase [Roseateles toxinivorans]
MKDGTIHHSFLSGAGVRLHVAQAGQTGCGSPVLLLHGFPDHWRLWESTMLALAGQHHVMAPDLRGINLSEKPLSVADYAIDHLVDDVLALIDHLGGRCALVGHDWGGMLAWVVAARHPAKVSCLAIFNAPHPCVFAQQLRSNPAQRAASEYVQRLCSPGAVEHLSQNHYSALWSVRADGKHQDELNPTRTSCELAWSQPGALDAAINWYRAVNFDAALRLDARAVPDLGAASGHIAMRTLVVWGERDGSFPVECLDELPQWVPQLTLRRVPDGGHWLLHDQPERVMPWLAEFLTEPS